MDLYKLQEQAVNSAEAQVTTFYSMSEEEIFSMAVLDGIKSITELMSLIFSNKGFVSQKPPKEIIKKLLRSVLDSTLLAMYVLDSQIQDAELLDAESEMWPEEVKHDSVLACSSILGAFSESMICRFVEEDINVIEDSLQDVISLLYLLYERFEIDLP